MTRTTSVTATFTTNARPDAQLSIGNGSFVGNDVYDVTGAGQTLQLRQPRGTTRTFRIRVQNDGETRESLAVSGPGSSSGFQLTYLLGTMNVTSRVTSGTFRTVDARSRRVGDARAHGQVPRDTPRGRVKNILVTCTSTSLAGASDAVLARVTVA